MANKGLEIIEAMHLFGVETTQIEVAIHSACMVHSRVEFCDGSFFAQLSPVSMKYATRHCLFYQMVRRRARQFVKRFFRAMIF
jgi:1-deoxy-D-xylulose-5-phosphate reductoisomerase